MKHAGKNWADRVESFSEEKGFRLTEPRRHVIDIIAKAEKPIGAYDILHALGQRIENPKPPTVYRAIEFLEQHGFIHRIESLNAYIACHIDHWHHGSQFMICDGCGDVTEAHLCHLPESLELKTKTAGFHAAHWNLEIHGLCHDCHKD